MKKIVGFFKSLIFFVILCMLVVMAYLHRDYLWQQTSMARAFYYVWQGDENIKANDFQAAIDNYKKALKVYPEHAKAHYNLGNIYFWYELYSASSEKTPVKVFRYNPKPGKFVLVIEQPTQDGDSENSAEAAYAKATEVYPDYINAWINLGIIKAQAYDLEGAIRSFMKAINANPMIINIPFLFNNEPSIKYNRAVAYYNLGHVYHQMAIASDYPEIRSDYLLKTLKYYQKSYEINPNSYKTNYNLGLVNQILDRESPAINQYCKAIKLEPFKFEAHYNLGILLKKQERYTAAAEELKKAAMMATFGVDSPKALYDVEGDKAKTNYIFRILSDASFRSAAMEQTQRKLFEETTYPYPEEGIIADVVVNPYLDDIKKAEAKEQETAKDKKDKEEKPLTKLEEAEMDFSRCVTDIDYYEKEKNKPEPDWIQTHNEKYSSYDKPIPKAE